MSVRAYYPDNDELYTPLENLGQRRSGLRDNGLFARRASRIANGDRGLIAQVH